jgi:hypothetical protein
MISKPLFSNKAAPNSSKLIIEPNSVHDSKN